MRVAVVTGAGGGMGRAIVKALLDQDMAVVGLDISAAALEQAKVDLGGRAGRFTTRAADLADATQVEAAFAGIGDTFGGIDALVNNAGTCFMSDFLDISAQEFEKQMAINFGGAFYCCQRAVPLMLKRPGVKKIVNISSNGAYNFDVFDPPHYRASKAALDNLTKDLARRYAADLIAVNSIAPAMTRTPLFDVLSQDVLDKAIAGMPHGRPMEPHEIAAWVAFLISPMGDIASGNVIILNQGRDVR